MSSQLEREPIRPLLITRALAESCRNDRLGLVETVAQLPGQISIDGFREVYMKLLNGTTHGGAEHGRLVMFNPDSGRLEFSDVVRGRQSTIRYPDPVKFLDAAKTDPVIQQAQTKLLQTRSLALLGDQSELGANLRKSMVHVVGKVHTHPDNTPISRADIMDTLSRATNRFHLVLEPGGRVTAIVTTGETRWIAPADKAQLQPSQLSQDEFKFGYYVGTTDSVILTKAAF